MDLSVPELKQQIETLERQVETLTSSYNECLGLRQQNGYAKTDEKFAIAFRSNPNALMLSYEDDGTIIDINDSFVNLFKRKRADVIGKSALSIGLYDDPAKREEIIEQLRSNGRITNRELKLRTGTGDERVVIFSTEVLNLGDRRALLSTLQDITESKKTEEKLRIEHNILEAVVNNIGAGFVVADTEGNILSMNESALKIHDFRSEEEKLDQLHQYVDEFEIEYPDGTLVPPAKWPLALAMKGEYVKDYRVRLKKRNYKNVKYISYNAVPVHGNEGKPMFIVLTLTDNTEISRRSTEIESILSCIAEGVVVYDREGHIIRANSAAENILKLKEPDKDLALAERVEKNYRVWTEDKRLLKTEEMPAYKASVLGETVKNELLLIEASGYPKWINISAAPLIIEGKHAGGIISMSDVTARKNAEQKLRENEEKFRNLADNIPPFTWMADEKGYIFWFNKRFFEYTGSTPEEMEGWGWTKVHHPDHLDRVMKRFRKAIETGATWQDTFPLRSKDGEYRWFLSRALPIRDQSGKIIRWFGSNSDVTELRRKEDTLRKNEQRLHGVFNNAAIGIVEVDINDRMITVNDRACGILGYTREELIGKNIREITSPEDLERTNEMNTRLHNGEFSIFEYEKRYVKREGTPIWVHVTVSAVRDANGKHLYSIGTFDDISERKKAEEALRKSERLYRKIAGDLRENEQRLQAIFDYAAIGIAEVDENDRFVEVNGHICDILGYRREELLQKAVHEITYPEDIPHSRLMNQKLHQGEIDLSSYEKRYIKKDGSLIWVNITISAIRNLEGRHVRTVRTIEDISARKKAEENLKQSETILKQAGFMANLGAWVIDYINPEEPQKNPLIWSDQTYRIFGYEPGSAEVTNDFFYERVVPSDRPLVRETLANALKERKSYTVEHRITRADGAERKVVEHAEITFDSSGNPLRIVGAVQDITERKLEEEKLRESEEKFRSLFENITEGVALHEIVYKDGKPVDYRIIDVNPAFQEHTGYDYQSVKGRLASEVYNSSEPPFLQEYAGVAESGKPYRFNTFYAPIGRHLIISAISPSKGRFATVFEDITEQKKNELEIKKKNEELTRFIYTVSHDLKSPLVTIKSFTAYLKEDIAAQDKAGQDKDINYIQNAADKMGKLLDELLELSRIGRKEKSKTSATLRTVAQSAIDLVAGRLANNNIKVEFTGPSVMLYGHIERFIQLYQNLLDNAAKFMGDQPRPFVEIGAFIDSERNNEIVLFVRDNGSGIDPRYHHKIFGLFEKMDNTTEGTGIGLALIKRIVEVHGGTIWFESEGAGKGTTFYFTLEGTQVINN